MDTIAGIAFLLIVSILIQRHDDRVITAAFGPRPCGYCPLGIHYDRSRHRWVHDDGRLEAPVGRYPNQTHAAHPGGTLL